MFYKIRCSLTFYKIEKERPALKSLFNKVAGLLSSIKEPEKLHNFIKKRLQHMSTHISFKEDFRTTIFGSI